MRAVRWLFGQFLKGCLVLFPIVGTIYAVWFLFSTVDQVVRKLLGLAPWWDSIAPGLGVLAALTGITVVGIVASNVVGRTVVRTIDRVVDHMPLVRLLYGAIRDIIGAFVGEQRSFDRPAVVKLGELRLLGFVTREGFEQPELAGCVAVYVPQSYNFAGNLLIVPRDAIELLDIPGSEFLALIVSGGVHRGATG